MFVYQPAVEGFLSLKVKVHSEGRLLARVSLSLLKHIAEVGLVISGDGNTHGTT